MALTILDFKQKLSPLPVFNNHSIKFQSNQNENSNLRKLNVSNFFQELKPLMNSNKKRLFIERELKVKYYLTN